LSGSERNGRSSTTRFITIVNWSALHEIQRELASGGYRLTEVRILDLLIWSLRAAT
jgi:hypothetical protein